MAPPRRDERNDGVRSGARAPGPAGLGRASGRDELECNAYVSWELKLGRDDACVMPDMPGTDPALSTARRKVGAWLWSRSVDIQQAEYDWGVDRRAVAGAIAFEALENVQSAGRHWISRRSFGPGKIHMPNWYSGKATTIQQTEFAGYLAWRGFTAANLKEALSTASGSITCIAAIMRSDADAATNVGLYDWKQTYWNAPVLAAWFQGKDLFDLVAKYAKMEWTPRGKPLEPGEIPMGNWVRDNLGYLEAFVGKPTVRKPGPIRGARADLAAALSDWKNRPGR